MEGARAASEALDAGVRVRFACATERGLDTPLASKCWTACADAGVDRLFVSEDEMLSIADSVTPQGFAVVCEEPRHDLQAVARSRLTIVLDGIRDPGNVGTLIRSAAALAAGGAVVLDGSADPWGTKAVRASAGMMFRLPVASAPWSEVERVIAKAGAVTCVADAAGKPVPLASSWPDRIALVIGSERSGVRAEARSLAGLTVAVPMRTGTESMNAAAAGAVLMWEILRSGRHVTAVPK
ncbi:MAG: RNA methyltransferase [Gemmatimonadetes bacterium]|nr:RNA methyltransferase [Gemmatimonadota bacterium]